MAARRETDEEKQARLKKEARERDAATRKRRLAGEGLDKGVVVDVGDFDDEFGGEGGEE